MGAKKTYAVFGLGRYGSAVARELVAGGRDVIAVDCNEERVSEVMADLPFCKCADVTDPEVIRQLGIAGIDVVIIAMANSLESSVLAITLCKDAGVPTVIVKCANELQRKILLRVGADEVVFPEKESGTRLAKNLLSSGFIDMIALSEDISMIELDVKPEWNGKSLSELNLRRKYGVNVVAVKKDNKVSVALKPEDPITEDMTLIVIGNTAKLRKLN